tara:strand:+ start:1187 stop:1582 length:396 start_codon:yes stop_codon:yes gene_type:complete
MYGLVWLSEKLLALAPTLLALKKENKALADSAISSLSSAITETSIYFSYIKGGGKQDRDREFELGRLWAAAALTLHSIDAELAALCEQKSEAWIRPDFWPKEKIEEYGIRLSDVKDKYKKLRTAKNKTDKT